MAVSDSEVLDVFEEADKSAFSTPELAEKLDISKAGAWSKLSKMAERGLVQHHAEELFEPDMWSLTEEGS